MHPGDLGDDGDGEHRSVVEVLDVHGQVTPFRPA
jgi:hypothetical protein